MGKEVLRSWLEETVTLRVLSWNILQGGGTRSDDILDVIRAHQCDIAVLQEFRHGKSSHILKSGLEEMGLAHQYAPSPESAKANTLIIAGKTPLDGEIFLPSGASNVPAALGLNIQKDVSKGSDKAALRIIGLHLPHKQKQVPYFDALLNLPDSYRQELTLLTGDFNCGIPFEDSETKTFYATHQFQALLKQGWTDSWRSRNPNAREFSWISTQKGNGFRYDHALASPELDSKITSIFYDHEPRKKRYSDHSVLIMDLDL